jgi:hypothetical protein
MVEAESSVVEGAAPAAAFVGTVADMARLGRETLTPESLITIAGRIDQIRIREGQKSEVFPVVLATARRGARNWATEKQR